MVRSAATDRVAGRDSLCATRAASPLHSRALRRTACGIPFPFPGGSRTPRAESRARGPSRVGSEGAASVRMVRGPATGGGGRAPCLQAADMRRPRGSSGRAGLCAGVCAGVPKAKHVRQSWPRVHVAAESFACRLVCRRAVRERCRACVQACGAREMQACVQAHAAVRCRASVQACVQACRAVPRCSPRRCAMPASLARPLPGRLPSRPALDCLRAHGPANQPA